MTVVPKGAISEDLGPGTNRISAGTPWRRMRCAVRCSALPRTRPTPVVRRHCNIIRQTNLHNFSSAAYYFGAHFIALRHVAAKSRDAIGIRKAQSLQTPGTLLAPPWA